MKLFILIIKIISLDVVIGQPNGRVNEGLLQCVVNIDGKGTGFLVARILPSDTSKCKIYLVTNKHMIGDWTLVDTLIPNPSLTAYLYSKNKTKRPNSFLDLPMQNLCLEKISQTGFLLTF